jgi:hypothetical protein
MCYNVTSNWGLSLHAPAPMLARQAVLLNSLKSALAGCLPLYKQIASITPLESALTGHSQLAENAATLTPAESAFPNTPPVTSLDSAHTKNWGREGGSLEQDFFPPAPRYQSRVTRYQSLSSSFAYPYELFCTRENHNSFVFFEIQTPLQRHRGVGYALSTQELLTTKNSQPTFRRSLPKNPKPSSLFSTACEQFCNFLHFFAPIPPPGPFVFNHLRTLLHLRGGGGTPHPPSTRHSPLRPVTPHRHNMNADSQEQGWKW